MFFWISLFLCLECNTVSLKLFGRSLNFTAGTLSEIESEAVDQANRSELNYGGRPDIRLGNFQLTQKTNYNFKFKMSDETYDAGQSFVPYFDATAITFDPPAPISSIGLSHFTNDDEYAGLVRPTIKSLDYQAFINEF